MVTQIAELDNVIIVTIRDTTSIRIYNGHYLKNEKGYWYWILPHDGTMMRITRKVTTNILDEIIGDYYETHR